MKNLTVSIILLVLCIRSFGQSQSLPFDVAQYKPMALPQVTAATGNYPLPGKLISYDLQRGIFDSTDIKPAATNVIITYPPSRRITEAELTPNAMKLSGFSALQPADQIQGFPGYPFSAIVKLYVTFTGQHVITAGHCVYDIQSGAWASKIIVVPAYNMGTSPYGYTDGLKWFSFNGYTQGHDWNYDVAVVQTTTPIGDLTGWLGWGSNMNNSFFTSSANTLSSIGYPAQDDNHNPVFEQGERMYAWNGFLDYWEGPNTVCHYNQGFHGQSGSALYYKNTALNDRFVYGVLSHGSPNPYHTCHCRIDNTMAGTIAGLMPPALGAGTSIANNLEIITYPAPATNSVTVDFGEHKFQIGIVEIRDLTGAIVKSAYIPYEKFVKIDLSDMQNGTYLLSASLDGMRYDGKIIKAE